MNRELIIKHFTDNVKQYQKYARNIAGEDADDLFQECSLMLLEFPEARLIGYWNPEEGLKPFFLKMLSLQYRSKTSRFDKEYRKQNRFIQEKGSEFEKNGFDIKTENEARAQMEDVEDQFIKIALDNIARLTGSLFTSDVERIIFDTYVEQGSLRKTLAALPDPIRESVDLKTVHETVRKQAKAIRSFVLEDGLKPAVKLKNVDYTKLSPANKKRYDKAMKDGITFETLLRRYTEEDTRDFNAEELGNPNQSKLNFAA